jgi:hypothetical protein
MATIIGILVLALTLFSAVPARSATDFGLAENSLSQFGAIRFENVYTRVPTTGKLVSIRITDSGTVYYICREKNGYAIYHLEIRPMDKFKEKIEAEIQETKRNWNKVHPDELLFTKERLDRDLKRKINKYSEAVWVRNEIVLPQLPKPRQERR